MSKEEISSSKMKAKTFVIEEIKRPDSVASEEGWKMEEDLSLVDKDSRENCKSKQTKELGKFYSSQDSKSKEKIKSEINLNILPKCNCQDLTKVEANLETKDLWEKFYELGTEMIITKNGR